MKVQLWANDGEFDTWASCAVDGTVNEYENSYGYSGYVLSIDCDVSSLSSKAGAGCCLRDNDELAGGGYCALWDEGN